MRGLRVEGLRAEGLRVEALRVERLRAAGPARGTKGLQTFRVQRLCVHLGLKVSGLTSQP